jgi:hypothetical protein
VRKGKFNWKVMVHALCRIVKREFPSERCVVVSDDTLEFIPIKPLAATGSGGPESYAGHSRFPSRHHERPASTGGFDDATTLDTAVGPSDTRANKF